MDKIAKALEKLNEKERVKLKALLKKIKAGDLASLDLKKLKGRQDVFRARQGDLRIIFVKQSEDIKILSLERRASKTYHQK